MKPKPIDCPSVKISAASPQVVQVERTANKGVVVRVAYPPGKSRDAMSYVAVIVVFFCGFAVLWYRVGLLRNPWALPYLAVLPASVILLAVWRALSFRQSYTFLADPEAITIVRRLGRREWRERLPRERIDDVRTEFSRSGRGVGPGYLMIAVKPWYRSNRRLLHSLGGDHLAHVTDALRGGIGLPPRSCP